MKKHLFVIFGIVCFFSFTVSGCEKEEVSVDIKETEDVVETENELGDVKGYYLVINGTKISVGMDMAQVVKVLGEPVNYFESESCADQGTAKSYAYSSFDIATDSVDGKDIIGYIGLKDDLIDTPEGVNLSMKKTDVIAVYGDNYVESENSLIYEKEGVKLSFILEEDNIISISYMLNE